MQFNDNTPLINICVNPEGSKLDYADLFISKYQVFHPNIFLLS